jgi:hypothetical protein
LTGVALCYLLQEAADGLVLHIQWAFGMKSAQCGAAAWDYAKRS